MKPSRSTQVSRQEAALLAKVELFSTLLISRKLSSEVGTTVVELLRRLISQDQAIANARAAATHVSRRRVERMETDLFLAELKERKASRSA
jgi:hypothetical protein